MNLLLIASGVFTIALGLTHFFMPLLFDFRGAIPTVGPELRPLRLPGVRYSTRRSDVLGIAWIMNHAVSYVLITIGVLDLLASSWLQTVWGRWLAVWIAGWWFLRGGCQLFMGRRVGDWVLLVGFCALGALHLVAALSR